MITLSFFLLFFVRWERALSLKQEECPFLVTGVSGYRANCLFLLFPVSCSRIDKADIVIVVVVTATGGGDNTYLLILRRGLLLVHSYWKKKEREDGDFFFSV